jgi:hypothetical protein
MLGKPDNGNQPPLELASRLRSLKKIGLDV